MSTTSILLATDDVLNLDDFLNLEFDQLGVKTIFLHEILRNII